MAEKKILLKHVSRGDVDRVRDWLKDEEVVESWFGRYSYGNPAHLGYDPQNAAELPDSRWNEIFENPEHRIFSIYTTEGDHIGETHIAIEQSLGDGQISILIGDKEKWHQGYGRAGLKTTLEISFYEYNLFRVWADIPEYNTSARNMFDHLGFTHEGTLRQSRPHEGARHDSVIMGMLATEYYPAD